MFALVRDTGDIYIHEQGLAYVARDAYNFATGKNAIYSQVTSPEITASTSNAPLVLRGGELEQWIETRCAGIFPRQVIDRFVMPHCRGIIVDAVQGALSLAPLPAGAAYVNQPLSSSNASTDDGASNLRYGSRGRRCFELFAVDFVLDEDLRPWLVSFSGDPDPTIYGSAGHAAILQSVYDGAARIAIDSLFPALSSSLSAPSMSTSFLDTEVAIDNFQDAPVTEEEVLSSLLNSGPGMGALATSPTEHARLSAYAAAYALVARRFPTGVGALAHGIKQENDIVLLDLTRTIGGWSLAYRATAKITGTNIGYSGDVETSVIRSKLISHIKAARASTADPTLVLQDIRSNPPTRVRRVQDIPLEAFRGPPPLASKVAWFRPGQAIMSGEILEGKTLESNTSLYETKMSKNPYDTVNVDEQLRDANSRQTTKLLPNYSNNELLDAPPSARTASANNRYTPTNASFTPRDLPWNNEKSRAKVDSGRKPTISDDKLVANRLASKRLQNQSHIMSTESTGNSNRTTNGKIPAPRRNSYQIVTFNEQHQASSSNANTAANAVIALRSLLSDIQEAIALRASAAAALRLEKDKMIAKNDDLLADNIPSSTSAADLARKANDACTAAIARLREIENALNEGARQQYGSLLQAVRDAAIRLSDNNLAPPESGFVSALHVEQKQSQTVGDLMNVFGSKLSNNNALSTTHHLSQANTSTIAPPAPLFSSSLNIEKQQAQVQINNASYNKETIPNAPSISTVKPSAFLNELSSRLNSHGLSAAPRPSISTTSNIKNEELNVLPSENTNNSILSSKLENSSSNQSKSQPDEFKKEYNLENQAPATNPYGKFATIAPPEKNIVPMNAAQRVENMEFTLPSAPVQNMQDMQEFLSSFPSSIPSSAGPSKKLTETQLSTATSSLQPDNIKNDVSSSQVEASNRVLAHVPNKDFSLQSIFNSIGGPINARNEVRKGTSVSLQPLSELKEENIVDGEASSKENSVEEQSVSKDALIPKQSSITLNIGSGAKPPFASRFNRAKDISVREQVNNAISNNTSTSTTDVNPSKAKESNVVHQQLREIEEKDPVSIIENAGGINVSNIPSTNKALTSVLTSKSIGSSTYNNIPDVLLQVPSNNNSKESLPHSKTSNYIDAQASIMREQMIGQQNLMQQTMSKYQTNTGKVTTYKSSILAENTGMNDDGILWRKHNSQENVNITSPWENGHVGPFAHVPTSNSNTRRNYADLQQDQPPGFAKPPSILSTSTPATMNSNLSNYVSTAVKANNATETIAPTRILHNSVPWTADQYRVIFAADSAKLNNTSKATMMASPAILPSKSMISKGHVHSSGRVRYDALQINTESSQHLKQYNTSNGVNNNPIMNKLSPLANRSLSSIPPSTPSNSLHITSSTPIRSIYDYSAFSANKSFAPSTNAQIIPSNVEPSILY